uniref:Uncharacterized protein n=1 Tax=Solanum lycopersicum TaxID=4081 RepID=A0A3Q7GUQ1_SOLLC
MAKARQRQGVSGVQAWKMCGLIRVDFDEIMNIQCLDNVLESKLWRKIAAKDRNPISKGTCQLHTTVIADYSYAPGDQRLGRLALAPCRECKGKRGNPPRTRTQKSGDSGLHESGQGPEIAKKKSGPHYFRKLVRNGRMIKTMMGSIREVSKEWEDDQGHSGINSTYKRIASKGLPDDVTWYVEQWQIQWDDVCKETTGIAQLFLDNIYKLHGMPEFIVSGRDLVLVSKMPPDQHTKEDYHALKMRFPVLP